jgi:hypothetical protein
MADPAAAQVSGYEVGVAYCLGVFEQRDKDAGGAGDEAARQQTLGTLQQYLTHRIGTRTPAPHVRALMAAREQGTRDQSECVSQIEASPVSTSKECSEKCRAPVREYELCLSCFAAEAKPEACERTTQCKPASPAQAAAAAPADRAAPSKPLQQPTPLASRQQRPPAPDPPAPSPPVARPPVAPPPAPIQAERAAPTKALPQPAPMASLPQRQPVPIVATPAPSDARQTATLPPAAARQEASRDAPTPAGACTVSRSKPGLQVYRVTCPRSWVTIGRTIDQPTAWTVSEGVESTEAIDFFMKSRYAR